LSNPVNRQTDIPTDAGENITSLADENISYIRLLAQPDRILWQVKEDIFACYQERRYILARESAFSVAVCFGAFTLFDTDERPLFSNR